MQHSESDAVFHNVRFTLYLLSIPLTNFIALELCSLGTGFSPVPWMVYVVSFTITNTLANMVRSIVEGIRVGTLVELLRPAVEGAFCFMLTIAIMKPIVQGEPVFFSHPRWMEYDEELEDSGGNLLVCIFSSAVFESAGGVEIACSASKLGFGKFFAAFLSFLMLCSVMFIVWEERSFSRSGCFARIRSNRLRPTHPTLVAEAEADTKADVPKARSNEDLHLDPVTEFESTPDAERKVSSA